MSSELSYEASDEASENELLDRSLSVWRGWSAIEWEDFTPIALDIHTACSIGQTDWVHSIIHKNESQIDRKNYGGWTPLMYACYIGHDDIVNLLIKYGCNMNMKNPRGHTPLMLAASCGNEGVARTLVRKNAQLEITDKIGWTALFHATYAGHQNFVAFLLQIGSNMDAIEPSTGQTPFMVAASEGHEIIVQLFLQQGVNVNARTYNGDTARSLALNHGYIKIASLIDNHTQPLSLRSDTGLYHSSNAGTCDRRQQTKHNLRLKSQGPSIRDGPEAIARMIDRTRHTDAVSWTNHVDTASFPDSLVPTGYVSFPPGQEHREETKLSHRDVTSPINPEDYKDSSGSREFDDFNDDSNAFTKTGAITIKSSSSSSGGLIAALGLSREGSIDSDDSHSCELTTSSSDDVPVTAKEVAGVALQQFDKADAVVTSPSHVTDNQTSWKQNTKPSPPDALDAVSQRNKQTMSADLKVDQPNQRVASLLHDYIPSGQPFKVGIGEPPHLYTDSCQGPAGTPIVQSHGRYQSLPKDNMSQMEIVNKFLKNLTVNNSEQHNAQFYGYKNRWASESRDNPTVTDSGCEIASTTMGYESQDSVPSHNSVSPRPAKKYSPKRKVSKDHKAVTSDIHSHQQTSMPQSQLGPGSNQDIHQNDFIPSTQQRTHHPQLNHHHPLHNRHHHNPLLVHHRHNPPTAYQDYIPNAMNNPTRHNSSQSSGMPYMSNFPSEYFYTDINSASSPFHPPEFSINPATSPPDYSAQLATAARQLSHLTDLFGDKAQTPPSCFSPVADSPSAGLSPSRFTPGAAEAESIFNPPQATVIIPGHATSQPVSSSLPWLGEGSMSRDGPRDLSEMLNQLGLIKYLEKFEEQDVDLQVFLSLTDNDLKELGIKLFGPRKKMTNAIARWHSDAPIASNSLEQAYADKLEGEMQEMAIQLNKAYENEERLKAQVLQEQQLRSVTESCLMEERTSWEQARQLLHETRGRMRTMGELLSRLRHHQKELRKHLENASSTARHSNFTLGGQPKDTARPAIGTDTSSPSATTSGPGEFSAGAVEPSGAESRHSPLSWDLLRKADNCLIEMQQTLTSLVQSADRILKSTHTLSKLDKETN